MLGEVVAGSLGGAALMAYAVRSPASNVFGPSVYQGSSRRKSVALTFDDGPSTGTEAVLKILGQFKAPATFFQCGANVARLPKVARAVLAEGHEIGNHTYSHARLYLKSRLVIEDEFTRAQTVLSETLGRTPRLMRPPFGIRWFGFREVQRKLGLLSVMWTVVGKDWKLTGGEVASRLMAGVRNGAILCLHDGRELLEDPDIQCTLHALADVLPKLQDRGYRFETVSQILCPTN